MFDEIPKTRPLTPLLDQINGGADLRQLERRQLPQLACELREFLLYSVGQSGGHFGAGLGVVELTIALHYVFETPHDLLVWDVGHQTYPHKILTGRRDQIHTIRTQGGLAGFPKRSESPYDTFGVGHSSTSMSAALGMALASSARGINRETVAVIGDGAMTAGMAFEALNHAAHTGANLLVILNDNNMSISPNVGGLATYFSKIWASKFYRVLRESSKKMLENLPHARELAKRAEEHMKGMVSPSTLFEELGFYYIGPIDGHDLNRLTHDLNSLREFKGPKLLHVITTKGKGFTPAERDPVGYHALNKIEPKSSVKPKAASLPRQKYQAVFGKWLCDQARQDPLLVGITPAMCEGSGMVEFSKAFPDRFHDVAIAEQHAVTLAAGLACEGQKPVVAIYSTFLQRAYDQLIHDVALQNLNVTFAIDRAGVVGEDGPTHSGAFDLAFLRCIPDMAIAAPSDENECYQLLSAAYQHSGAAAVRYPRGIGTGVPIAVKSDPLPVGKGRLLLQGTRVCLLNFGVLLAEAQDVARRYGYTLCDMRWVKPLDTELIKSAIGGCQLVVTLEEGCIAGGAGSAVTEFMAAAGIVNPVLQIGLPDTFIEHADRKAQLASVDLDLAGIEHQINQRLKLLEKNQPATTRAC